MNGYSASHEPQYVSLAEKYGGPGPSTVSDPHQGQKLPSYQEMRKSAYNPAPEPQPAANPTLY